ncbi:MAG: phosphonate ABC transporter substrate-binding protein [Alphaproteobacteria bacterium]|nr:phosphonate ABC transporter substrate-binding protein [Alphaproteobacteria bacterium]
MLRKTIKVTALAAAATLMAGTAMAQYKPLEGDPKVVNFGIISTESTQNLKTAWVPLIEDMEAAIGLPVKPFFAPDYAGVIEAMRFGKVHVAWFGNKSAMEAVDRAGGEVFVQEIKATGEQGYYSHILVHADNNKINSLKDLFATCAARSTDFGIGDPNSTSGFLVPSFYVFAQNGIDPKECFKTVRSANHETNLMAVANKQVDAAANNSEQIARSKLNAPGAARNIKIIWTSPLIPADPLVYRRDLSKSMKAKIKGFFLSYGRLGPDAEKQQAVLSGLGSGGGGYTDSSNAQLIPIRQLALFRDKLKLEADSRMSAEDKAAKISQIEEKLSELKVLEKNLM